MAYERIIRRIEYIENKMLLLEQWIPESDTEFKQNLILQNAIERLIQIIIESIIQICIHLVKYFHLGPPTSEEDMINLLEPKLQHYKLILELKRFRNFLVHQYLKVDADRVFNYLQQFKEDVRKIVDEFSNQIS